MPERRPQENLGHIAFEREPDLNPERRRRNPPPRPPRVAGRAEHGGRLARDLSSASGAVAAARQEAGLDPSRLLVLEFSTWDPGARDVFEERLNASVVDERAETRQVTRVIAVRPEDDAIDAVADRIASRRGARGGASPFDVGLRIRSANQGDLDRAKRAGSAVSDDLAPQKLVALESVDWGLDSEADLRDLGLVPVATIPVESEVTRVLVQFPTVDDVQAFTREAQNYVQQETRTTALPHGLRRGFFDGLDRVRARNREDRLGARLRAEGLPALDRFAIDVDLWHPGTRDGAREVLNEIRRVCSQHGGQVLDDLRTSSMVLARIDADRPLAEMLLGLDIVAQVNLPPLLPAAYEGIFRNIDPLPEHLVPDGTEPVVGVVDSGVLSGHPLLRGWVLEERDFDSGESTPVDTHGHGTQVAGLVVYGDIARCAETGDWTPRTLVASAKVLRRDPVDGSRPVFPDNHRPEKLVEDAIRYYHGERAVRVFNLSLGNAHDVCTGGRQFAWAEVLDQLARELDVVIVVSAGNLGTPPWPENVSSREQFQEGLRDLMLETPEARICSPGTAAIAVTTGAIARSETAMNHLLAGAPVGGPSPFSRLGPGYEVKETQRAVKPEFVSFGGNYAVRDYPGPTPDWVRNDIHLGEPTTRLNTDGGRPLTAVSGTSFSAPQVSFAAAFALRTASETLGTDDPTANSARALLGACADVPPCGPEWLKDPEGKETWDKLRLVGYGQVDVGRVVRALDHDVCLLAEDELSEDHWHLYSIRVPPAFLEGRGKRGLVVSLAFDPPVRASRRDYLSRTMWVEVLKGLTASEINQYRSRHTGSGTPPRLPQSKLLAMRPTKSDVQWSTLQVRKYGWARAINLPVSDAEGERELHVLVGCQQRFPTGESNLQRYALAVRFWHSDTSVEIHQQLRGRVRARVVARVRPRG